MSIYKNISRRKSGIARYLGRIFYFITAKKRKKSCTKRNKTKDDTVKILVKADVRARGREIKRRI